MGLKRRTFFGWGGVVTILALALVNDFLLLPLAENHSQVAFLYAALMTFVRGGSLGHFIGGFVDSVKQRKIQLPYPGALTLAVFILNLFGVLGIRTP